MTRKSVWGMGIQLSIFKEIYFYCHIVFGGVGWTRYPLMRVCLAVMTARSVNDDTANRQVDLLLLFLFLLFFFLLLLLLISAIAISLKLAASCDDPRTWRHHFLVLQSQHYPGKRFSFYFIITFPTDGRRIPFVLNLSADKGNEHNLCKKIITVCRTRGETSSLPSQNSLQRSPSL